MEVLSEAIIKLTSQQPQMEPPGGRGVGIIDIPSIPDQPKLGTNLDGWFDWYHACREKGLKATLQDVADKSGYSLSYIKQQHVLYRVSLEYQNEPKRT
jgi:hypothetical protein